MSDIDTSWINKETYLGDGLYASFDGFQFRLRAPRENGDHEVCLEPSTLNSFEQFVADIRAKIKAFHAGQTP